MGYLELAISIVKLIPRLLDLAERIHKNIEKGQLDAWVDKLETAVITAEKAQTSEDRIKAARAWADVLRSMRRRPQS